MIREDRGAREEVQAIDRRRFWIVASSIMALAVLAAAPWVGAPASAVIVVAVIILISVKKAMVNYVALGRRKAQLLEDSPAA